MRLPSEPLHGEPVTLTGMSGHGSGIAGHDAGIGNNSHLQDHRSRSPESAVTVTGIRTTT